MKTKILEIAEDSEIVSERRAHAPGLVSIMIVRRDGLSSVLHMGELESENFKKRASVRVVFFLTSQWLVEMF